MDTLPSWRSKFNLSAISLYRDYLQPLPYAGPIVTTLGCTTVNSTYFKWIYRCQNCTTLVKHFTLACSYPLTDAFVYANLAGKAVRWRPPATPFWRMRSRLPLYSLRQTPTRTLMSIPVSICVLLRPQRPLSRTSIPKILTFGDKVLTTP
jgi:hypothetical protein